MGIPTPKHLPLLEGPLHRLRMLPRDLLTPQLWGPNVNTRSAPTFSGDAPPPPRGHMEGVLLRAPQVSSPHPAHRPRRGTSAVMVGG